MYIIYMPPGNSGHNITAHNCNQWNGIFTFRISTSIGAPLLRSPLLLLRQKVCLREGEALRPGAFTGIIAATYTELAINLTHCSFHSPLLP